MPQTTGIKITLERIHSLSNSKADMTQNICEQMNKQIEIKKECTKEIQKEISNQCQQNIQPYNVTCDICDKEITKEEHISFECGHNYHAFCIQTCVIEQIDEESFPIMCPIEDCETEPSMLLLSVLIDRENFQACLDFETSLCPIINQNNCYNCGQRFFSDSEVSYHQCIKCKAVNCLQCNQKYHPNQKCSKKTNNIHESHSQNIMNVIDENQKAPVNSNGSLQQIENQNVQIPSTDRLKINEVKKRISVDIKFGERRRQSDQPAQQIPITQLFQKSNKSSILNSNIANNNSTLRSSSTNKQSNDNINNSPFQISSMNNSFYVNRNTNKLNSQDLKQQQQQSQKYSHEKLQQNNKVNIFNSPIKLPIKRLSDSQVYNLSSQIKQSPQIKQSSQIKQSPQSTLKQSLQKLQEKQIQQPCNNDLLNNSLYSPEASKFRKVQIGNIQHRRHRNNSPIVIQLITSRN